MTATIKDIANRTGLGVATISAYLNGINVRPKNKEIIEAAIKELGYVRNDYARGLKTHRSMTIGVLIPELSNVFSTTIISEMEDILREKGYGIIVCDCRSNAKIEESSLQFLMSKMIDGLIVMPLKENGKLFAPAIDRSIPIVAIDRITQNDKVSHIVINNREVSERAVEKLMKSGHRDIAIITGSSDVYTARERKYGYEEALKKENAYNSSYIYVCILTTEGGYLAMKEIMEHHKDVTAVFATNYEMSIGAIIAINESGKHIPEDYSFVGFDNMELANVFSPKLITVNQPLKEMGRMAAEMVLSRIAGKPNSTVTLNAEITQGGSIKTK